MQTACSCSPRAYHVVVVRLQGEMGMLSIGRRNSCAVDERRFYLTCSLFSFSFGITIAASNGIKSTGKHIPILALLWKRLARKEIEKLLTQNPSTKADKPSLVWLDCLHGGKKSPGALSLKGPPRAKSMFTAATPCHDHACRGRDPRRPNRSSKKKKKKRCKERGTGFQFHI